MTSIFRLTGKGGGEIRIQNSEIRIQVISAEAGEPHKEPINPGMWQGAQFVPYGTGTPATGIISGSLC